MSRLTSDNDIGIGHAFERRDNDDDIPVLHELRRACRGESPILWSVWASRSDPRGGASPAAAVFACSRIS
jgi:hypothetical protein